MHAMAEAVSGTGRDVLEVGFGLGISATRIVELGCRSYTVLEANPAVARRARDWARGRAIPIRVVEGLWQERLGELGDFDGIFWDPRPRCWREATDDSLFATLQRLYDHLAPGGGMTWFWRYHRALPASHQRWLSGRFESVQLRLVEGLVPPPHCNYWRDTETLVVSVHRAGVRATPTR